MKSLYYITRHAPARHNMTVLLLIHDITRYEYGMARHDTARHGTTWGGITLHDTWYCMT